MVGFEFARVWAELYALKQLSHLELQLLEAYLEPNGSHAMSHAMSSSMTVAMDTMSISSGLVDNIRSGTQDVVVNRSVPEDSENDTLILSLDAQESVFGGIGNDIIVLQELVTEIDGGDGHDALILPWSFEDVAFSMDDGSILLSNADARVSLSQIEMISFEDTVVKVHAIQHDLEQGLAPSAEPSLMASIIKYLPEISEDGSFDWGDVDQGQETMMSEEMAHMMAVMDLVPAADATNVAVKSGDWSDPSIWSAGRVPIDNEKVFIPAGSQVVVDGVFEASLFTVRVDGKLSFDPKTETGLTLDTMIIASDGALEMGTLDNPIDGDARARITISDNGPIDLTWDPQQLSRGIVAMGNVAIYGEEKTTHLKVTGAPDAGDTQITLSDVPVNWAIGDSIVLTGTEFVPKSYNPETGDYDTYNGTQDEVRVITGINGNTVQFDDPLDYDHHVPADGLAASVANMSRSIIWETENADEIPANQRAHSMFMHNDDVVVQYLQVQEFGRTDRSYGMDDYETYVMQNEWNSEGRVTDSDGNWVEGDATNVRGRYALHFHMAGVDTDDEAGLIKGSAVWGSPGWGYVQHNSYANFEDNVAFEVYGSAFAAETGNEVGRWENNLAIAGEGREEYIKWGNYNMDLGGEGYGFWMNGRSIDLIDNIAVGMSGGGFAWFSRGIDMIETDADNLEYPELARGLDTIHDVFLPFGEVTGNEVYASEVGFFAIRGIETGSQQLNDSRSVITDFAAWEVQQGFHIEYSSSYTFFDGLILSADFNDPDGNLQQVRSAGINIQRNYEDLVLEDVQIEGFNYGIYHTAHNPITVPRQADGFVSQEEDGWGLRFINVDIEANNDYSQGINQAISIVDPDHIQSYDLSLDIDNATLAAVWNSDDARFSDPLAVDRGIVLEGTKYDSLGAVSFPDGNERIYYTRDQVDALLSRDGYLTDEDGDRFLFIEELITDRRTGEGELQPMVVAIDPDWEMPHHAYDNGLHLAGFEGWAEIPEVDLW